MQKKIQIGSSDFKELIEGNNYFVDKSLLIKEFIENGAKIILTPRPRRFGKTLNLSMLKYFFDIRTKEETRLLFNDLKIENEKEIMRLQGEYPVIFITFKNNWILLMTILKMGLHSLCLICTKNMIIYSKAINYQQ